MACFSGLGILMDIIVIDLKSWKRSEENEIV